MRVQFGRAWAGSRALGMGMGMGRLQSPRPYLIVLRSPGPCGPGHQALLLPWAPGPGHQALGTLGHMAMGPSALNLGLAWTLGLCPTPLLLGHGPLIFLRLVYCSFEGVLKNLCT